MSILKLTVEDSLQMLDFIIEKGLVPILLQGKRAIYNNWNLLNQNQGKDLCVKYQEKVKDFFNIGIVCGINSNICVLDIDSKTGGIESWNNLLKENSNLIENTFIVKTGNNGYHYYFKYNNRYNHLKNKYNVLPGIDFKSQDSYIIAPYSISLDNNQLYIPINTNNITEMPEWLYKKLL